MEKPDKIIWRNEKRKLSDLIPWEINPAQINEKQAKRLEESLDEFGQIQTIAISPDNEIYDGHQRQLIWGASNKFGENYEVDVRVSSRKLTEQERKKLVIYLRKGTTGELNFDILANNWDADDLVEWGFEEYELGIYGDLPTLDELEDEYGELDDKAFWLTIKIDAPPEIMHKWEDIKESLPGIEDWEKFDALISGNMVS